MSGTKVAMIVGVVIIAVVLTIAVSSQFRSQQELAFLAPEAPVSELAPVTAPVALFETAATSAPQAPSLAAVSPEPSAASQSETQPIAFTTLSQTSNDDPERVKQIQTALQAAGFDSGAIDGRFGQRTEDAVKAFQQAKGLAADGKVGSRTWTELEKYLTTTQQE